MADTDYRPIIGAYLKNSTSCRLHSCVDCGGDVPLLYLTRGLQSELSGRNGHFQPLYAKISRKRQVVRPWLLPSIAYWMSNVDR